MQKIRKAFGKASIIYEKQDDNSLKELKRSQAMHHLAMNAIQRKCIPTLRMILQPVPPILVEFTSPKELTVEEVKLMLLQQDRMKGLKVEDLGDECTVSGIVPNKLAEVHLLKEMRVKNNILHVVAKTKIKVMGMRGEIQTKLRYEVDGNRLKIRESSKIKKNNKNI